ncbi:hypothetical protein SDC9_127744 [bioreactor metagenome]|uniref:Uncharacterized protein n=1 Tax=bioreactor metagenome TaxID=1076179 RepID=A0A645CUX4_9ZZZZ
MAERSHCHAGISQHAIHQSLYIPGAYQRFIALQIDIDVCGDLSHPLSQAVRAGRMILRGHHPATAKCLHGLRHAIIIGCHQHGLYTCNLARALVHMLNHGFARNISQGLSGQAGGAIAGRNHNGYCCTCASTAPGTSVRSGLRQSMLHIQ